MPSPVSSQDANSPQRDMEGYTDLQMVRDMRSMLDKVTTAHCSRANSSSSAQEDGDGLERPAKQQ